MLRIKAIIRLIRKIKVGLLTVFVIYVVEEAILVVNRRDKSNNIRYRKMKKEDEKSNG